MTQRLIAITLSVLCGLRSTAAPPERWLGPSATTRRPDFSIAIRVLLERETPSGRVETKRTIFLRRSRESSWEPLGKALRIHVAKLKGVPRIHIEGVSVESPTIYLRGASPSEDFLTYRHEQFRGVLRFSLRGTGLSVTNVLSLEDYLLGTLAKEMSGSWELEALKAQAVASRTYALYMMEHPRSSLHDVERGVQDQVYAGVQPGMQTVERAVRETAGLYLGLPKSPLPIKAHFHSRCGGATDTALTVWRQKNPAFLRHVPCPFCQKNRATWKASLGFPEFFRRMGLPESQVAPTLSATQTSPTGRIATLTLGHQEGKTVTVSTDEFRNLLGYSRIKSARFDWKIGDQAVEFEGVGAGHGVGMCQWGARHFARQGKSHLQILAHYYPDSPLYRLDP